MYSQLLLSFINMNAGNTYNELIFFIVQRDDWGPERFCALPEVT